MNKNFLLLVFLVITTSLSAGEKRAMTMVDMLEIPTLSSPRLSPDGSRLLYRLSGADWKANKRIGHLYLQDTDGGEPLQLTNGENGEREGLWSPDGGRIAFVAKRSGEKKSQIYLISVAGGEALQLSHHKTSTGSIEWSPDGLFIYFIADDERSVEEKNRRKKKDDVYTFTENFLQRHLWRINVKSGREEKITDGDFSVLGYRLSDDGTQIVFHRADSPLRDERDNSEIWIMRSDGNELRRLTFNSVPEWNAQLSADNSMVLFITFCNDKFEKYYNNNVFILPAAGGEAEMLLGEWPFEVQDAEWADGTDTIYLLGNMVVNNELFRVDVKKDTAFQLTDGRHSIRNWDYNQAENVFALGVNTPENAGDIRLFTPGQPDLQKRITHVYDYLRQFDVPQQESVRWTGEDGITVEGLLHYPLNYKKGNQYPLIVMTHGGPRSSDKYGFGRWRTNVPVYAAMGYAVLMPNYRGSTGYGDEFLRDMVGHYFNHAHKDVLAGVDYLINQGIADPARLAKAGWSAGGHMTNKIITCTDRFAAASSGAGAVNWISMYAQSDTRVQRTPWFGGTPWQKNAPLDIYMAQSPITEIWKVKTPTIIFVGENDPRVPMPQSVELYRALKSNGVPTKLFVAPREGHGWRELRHELFKMNAEMEWFEKYVNGREFEWEKAPEEKTNEKY